MRIFSICKNFKFIPIATSNIPTTTSKKDKLSVLLTKKIIRRWIQQTVRSRSQQRQLRRLRKFNLITDTTKLIYFLKKLKILIFWKNDKHSLYSAKYFRFARNLKCTIKIFSAKIFLKSEDFFKSYEEEKFLIHLTQMRPPRL